MRIKISVTLLQGVVIGINELSGGPKNRSEFIEAAVRAYIARTGGDKRNARDLEIINQHGDRLNEEALDVLAYQAKG